MEYQREASWNTIKHFDTGGVWNGVVLRALAGAVDGFQDGKRARPPVLVKYNDIIN